MTELGGNRLEGGGLVDAVHREGLLLADAAATLALNTEVPSCPEWTVRDLVAHVGGVHRWAASYVSTGRDRPWPRDEEQRFFAAPGDDALVAWFRDGHAALVDTLRGARGDVACWSFLPAASPLEFWARRQAHETAIHRVDAELAAGARPAVDPALATDGIDELVSGFLARRGRLVADPPASLAVETTDTLDRWVLRIEPGGCSTTRGGTSCSDSDCVVAGRASDLYLFLWNRGSTEPLEVLGDARVLELWSDKARVTWS